MKSAVIFLVAVTVSTSLFLETSTASVDSTTSGDTIKVDASLIQSLDEAMKCSQNAKGRAIKIIEDALLLVPEDAAKKGLNKASIWAKEVLEICIQLNVDMNNALRSGSTKAIEKVSTDISEAIVLKEAELIQLNESLVGVDEDVKAAFNKEMETNFAIDKGIDAALKELLSGVANTLVA